MQNTNYKSYDLQISRRNYAKNTCYFEGYASIFNTIDCDNEMILNDAVDYINFDHEKFFNNGHNNENDENEKQIIILWQHSLEFPIGKTISIFKDDNGLFIKGKILTDITKGFETYRLIKEGVVNGLSIGFTPISSYYNHDNIKVFSEINICEISIVCFPANKDALITDIKNTNKHNKYVDTNLDTKKLICKIDSAINAIKSPKNYE